MQVLATKTGERIKLTKTEKKLLDDCREFCKLLGKHGSDAAQTNAAGAVAAIGKLQVELDPPDAPEAPDIPPALDDAGDLEFEQNSAEDPLASDQTKVKLAKRK